MKKGDLKGECNRTVCKNTNALWYNHSTKKHYCNECAALINFANAFDSFKMYGHDLCTFVKEKADFVDVEFKIRNILGLHLNNFYQENGLSVSSKSRTETEDKIINVLMQFIK